MLEAVAAETAPTIAGARLVDHLDALDAEGGLDLLVTLPRDLLASPALADQHVEDLVDELIWLESHLPSRPKARSLFLSGAANRLTRDGMVKLLGALRHVFPFAPGVEIAADIDLSAWADDWASAAAFHGLTLARFSVAGDQVDTSHHAVAVLTEAVCALADAGVTRFSIDLASQVEGTPAAGAGLDALIRLGPERVGFAGEDGPAWARERLCMAGFDERAPGQFEHRPISTTPLRSGRVETSRIGLGPGASWRIRNAHGTNPEAVAWRAAVVRGLARASE